MIRKVFDLKQCLAAFLLSILSSFIYTFFVGNYCITSFETNTGYADPNKNNYYSQIAKYPIVLPSAALLLIGIIIFILTKKKFKIFAFYYIVIITIIVIMSMLFTKTYIVSGI